MLLGNGRTVDYFRASLQNGTLPHAFLIEGAEGSGKLTLARFLSSLLLCEGGEKPCGVCGFCRRIRAGQFPDVTEFYERDEAKSLSIDTIRTILSDSFILPNEAEKRIFIIGDFKLIQPRTQNVLLKIIEEPPGNVIFFLLTSDRSAALPTIRSRTVFFRTEPLDKEIVRRELQKQGGALPDNLDSVLRFSAGSLGMARKLLSDSAFRENKKTVDAYFEKIGAGASLAELCETLPPGKTKREQLPVLTELMIRAVRDLMACRAGAGGDPLYFESRGDAETVCGRVRMSELGKAAEMLYQIKGSAKKINVYNAVTMLNLCFAPC